MNRSPTPDGVFATNFVGVRWCFAECFTTNLVVDVGNWRTVSQPISWWTWGIGEWFAAYFVGVKGTFTKCSPRVRNLFDIHSPNVRNVFAICLIYIRKMFATCWLSVYYILTEQKGGFCMQKYGFWRAKRGFLMDKNRVLHF